MTHHSLNTSRRLVLLCYFLFCLLPRLMASVTVLNLPILIQTEFMQITPPIGPDFSNDPARYRHVFVRLFPAYLADLSHQCVPTALTLIIGLFVHYVIIFVHATFTVVEFSLSPLEDRLFHCLSCTWAPLPFRTLRGIDHGKEIRQDWFLLTLHSIENLCLVIGSVLMYVSAPVLPRAFLYFILPCIIFTLLSFLFKLLYEYKIRLFSGLPKIPTILQVNIFSWKDK